MDYVWLLTGDYYHTRRFTLNNGLLLWITIYLLYTLVYLNKFNVSYFIIQPAFKKL